MSSDYIILIMVIIGLLGCFTFWKIIKKFHYELNFKESILFSTSILMLTSLSLIDFNSLKININFMITNEIVAYLLILLLLYYIIRSIKLKKYIPLKCIILYISISLISIIILFNILDYTNNINVIDAFALYINYIIIYPIYILILLSINTIIFLLKIIKRSNNIYINKNYKLSKISFFHILSAILIIGLIFVIDYYNKISYHKIIEEQRKLVINYLNTEYSNYNFEIINSYETKVDCGFMTCMTPAFRNEIKSIELNKIFIIDVKKQNLIIYADEFKEILKEEKLDNTKNIYNNEI